MANRFETSYRKSWILRGGAPIFHQISKKCEEIGPPKQSANGVGGIIEWRELTPPRTCGSWCAGKFRLGGERWMGSLACWGRQETLRFLGIGRSDAGI